MTDVFVGRAAELRELGQGLEQALTGRGRLFLITGEPGIGKTRLATELAMLGERRGAAVHWGHCWDAGTPPFWPWLRLARSIESKRCGESVRTEPGCANPVARSSATAWVRRPRLASGLQCRGGA